MALRVLILVLLCASLRADDASLRGFTMGTRWNLTWRSGEIEDPNELLRSVEGRLEEIETSMSTWRTNSEISRFNASGSTNWFPVSEEFASVLRRGLEISKASRGALDPTVFPLVRLWGFMSGAAGRRPDGVSVSNVLRHVDYRLLDVRLRPPALRKRDGEVKIDLSSFAKGHAVDVVAGIVQSLGASNWLVDIGGELRGLGHSAKQRSWRIGIELPVPGTSQIHSVLEVASGAVATSGDYRNYIAIDGVRHAHIIDPASGNPIRQRGFAVSVRGDDCLTADAWATAMSVLGSEKGLPLAQDLGLNVMFIEGRPSGFQVNTVGEWPLMPRVGR